MQPSVSIIGTGASLPHDVWTIRSVRDAFGADAATQAEASGVLRRHYCAEETQIDLACAAANRAIQSARVDVADIDLIISASAVPYQTLPATASLVMSRLGLADGAAAAFDVNSTCLSFLTGLEVATRMIQSGQA